MFVEQLNNRDDVDDEYFSFVGHEFITAEERRLHEQQEPYVYVSYLKTIST